jgi:DNA helicase-2/ATP-dependent DNA helicase PcrA
VTQTPSTRSISEVLDRAPGLEDDPEAARIVGEELKLLSTVQRALEARSAADISAARGRALDDAHLLELRDDVAVAKPEDLPALFDQMHNLGALRAQRGRSITGSVDRSCPYFGHMRLEESVPESERRRIAAGQRASTTRRRDVLVGTRSYIDSGQGIRIADWRHAPVSRIYYRYGEGDSYEEELGNRMVEGLVVARRGLTIVGGQLVRVSAPQGTFVRGKDARWRRVSAQSARLETEKRWGLRHGIASEARLGIGADGQLRQDKHLPAIAALLDDRQYQLITQGTAQLVAIQGSAGSGKTTVGLHRVAYLAFQEPQRFRPERMFVVVPNEALIHYVSRVLPALGVEGVPVTTFARFATRLVAQLFPRLPTKASEETPPVVSRESSRASAATSKHAFAARWPSGPTEIASWRRGRRQVPTGGCPRTRTSLCLRTGWPASACCRASTWLPGCRK